MIHRLWRNSILFNKVTPLLQPNAKIMKNYIIQTIYIVSFDMLNEFAIFKSYLTYNVINFDTNIFEQIPHNRSHKYNNTYVVIIFSNNCLVSALFFVSQNLREFIHPIYSCKEKERCGRGNCDLKRNVTNLLSWNILLTKKIFWTTHINFSSYH